MGLHDKIVIKYGEYELDVEDITYSGDEPILSLGNNLGQQTVLSYYDALKYLNNENEKELLDNLVEAVRERK